MFFAHLGTQTTSKLAASKSTRKGAPRYSSLNSTHAVGVSAHAHNRPAPARLNLNGIVLEVGRYHYRLFLRGQRHVRSLDQITVLPTGQTSHDGP